MKKFILRAASVCVIFSFGGADASVGCGGTITAMYRWMVTPTYSIQLKLADGSKTNWVNLPNKNDEALALAAAATGKQVYVVWSAADVTKCTEGGWTDNRQLDGYFQVVFQ